MNANRALQIALSDRPALINAGHKRIAGLVHSVINESRAVGDVLLGAQEQVSHGGWALWQSSNCPDIAPRTLRGYMQLARHCQDHPEDIKKLEGMSLEGALRRLASPKTAGARQFESQPGSPQHTEPSIDDETPAIEAQAAEDVGSGPYSWEGYEPFAPDETAYHAKADQEFAEHLDRVVAATDGGAELLAHNQQLSRINAHLKMDRDGEQHRATAMTRQLKVEMSRVRRLRNQISRQQQEISKLRQEIERLRQNLASSPAAPRAQ